MSDYILSNRSFASLLLLACSFIAIGQDDNTPGLDIGFYGGLSVPLGDFNNEKLSDWEEHCGCANTNGSFALKARVRVKGGLYGILNFNWLWNSYDPKPIAGALNDAFNAPFSVETDSWKSRIVQLGIGYDFELSSNEFGEKLILSFEGTGVMNDLETYFFRIQSPDGSNRYPLRQASVDDTGFGYSFGFSLLHDWDGIGARISMDYLTSNHSISGADRRFNGGDLIPQSYDQKVEVLLIQVGLVLRVY
ncbi:MAG: hypothetical protein ABJG47_04295 [Ekhidna sp.]